MWHLTSRLTEQEVAEAAEFNSNDDDNDTKATKQRPGKKGSDNENMWLNMFPNHRGMFSGGGMNPIYWANRGKRNFEDGVAYMSSIQGPYPRSGASATSAAGQRPSTRCGTIKIINTATTTKAANTP